jgi:hypothetical protein
MSMLRITINGVARELDVANDMPLIWVLRDTLGLKGTKYGCGVGGCGICTVLADGEPLRSCVVSTGDIGGGDIVTIEGLAQQGHSLLAAWDLRRPTSVTAIPCSTSRARVAAPACAVSGSACPWPVPGQGCA